MGEAAEAENKPDQPVQTLGDNKTAVDNFGSKTVQLNAKQFNFGLNTSHISVVIKSIVLYVLSSSSQTCSNEMDISDLVQPWGQEESLNVF